jgi:hypothetical protein
MKAETEERREGQERRSGKKNATTEEGQDRRMSK